MPSTRNTSRRVADWLIAKSVRRGTFWCQLFVLTVCVPCEQFCRPLPARSITLVRADGRLDFALVNIKIRVYVLYVVVFFQRLDQPQHLLGLLAGQFHIILWNHS